MEKAINILERKKVHTGT